MEDENRSFSWSGLFIKIILVIVFLIFTIWLISLSTKDMSDSIDVITNNIFADNLEKMKKVGKEYFTKDRLPLNKGDIETLTLEEMYDKDLILELKDKYGNACSKENSYISVEKLENEYQMKVYLECEKEKDYVILNFSCIYYENCNQNTNKNESNKDSNESENNKESADKIEYEYVKNTNGTWSDWGKWSDWTKVEITKLDNRDVETKVEKEQYSYTEEVTKVEKLALDKICPEGYTLYNNTCKKTLSTLETKTENPICSSLEGYTLTGRDGFTCTYAKSVKGERLDTKVGETIPADTSAYIYEEVGNPEYILDKTTFTFKWVHTYAIYQVESKTETTKAICPKGYVENGNICKKDELKTDTIETSLICPVTEGYTLKNDQNNCQYEKETLETINKIGEKEVTYYRYRIREYLDGTTTYKWSSSKNDKTLLNAGYKLTGKTR